MTPSTPTTAIHEKIKLAESGQLPRAIVKLPSGWVVAGEVQPLKGYCLLLSDPVARDLNQLSGPQRIQYCQDMVLIGDALLAELGAYRINYETWGNQDPALHTHIVPRFQGEPPVLRVQTPRQAYDWAKGRPFDPVIDGEWMVRVKNFLISKF